MDQRLFTNCVRSLFNIDGYLLPELTSAQQGEFIRDPVRYFIGTDKVQQNAIFREVGKRQAPLLEDEAPDARDIIAKHAGLGNTPYFIADRIIAELSKAGFAIVKGEVA